MRSCNHCESGKAISITYCECGFVALRIQHAIRMRRITVSTVACQALQYFSTYLTNGTIFGEKKVIQHKMRVLISTQI
jgi:hypothetical protein